MEKQAFEPTGLIPRSIIRTVDRFVQQLLPGREKIALQEYRVSRYQILVSIKSLLTLILIPLIISSTIKGFIFTPLVEHFWNNSQSEIFLNEYQEKRAFSEMHDFSEKLFFESLLVEPKTIQVVLPERNDLSPAHTSPHSVGSCVLRAKERLGMTQSLAIDKPLNHSQIIQSAGLVSPIDCMTSNDTLKLNEYERSLIPMACPYEATKGHVCVNQVNCLLPSSQNLLLNDALHNQTLFQMKSLELAKSYNKQSILAITNLLGDFLTFFTVSLLFQVMRPELIILKSFLTESVYSLSDTTKSFLLILGMDLLVGFHSPRGWELALEGFLRHIGLPENENFILLFVALFPVFLDTVFKYWIFRYLNKISPSTVVTYHSMIE